jgi:hypothetical protein
LTEQFDALPLFGYGPLVSYAIIAARLVRGQSIGEAVLPEIVVGSQYEQLSEDKKRDRDLLLLGYPAGNDATRILEPLMGLPVEFAILPKRALLSKETGATIAEPVYLKLQNGSRRTISDCGLVARVKHPLNPRRTVLYLAGCETFGVKIAAESLRPEFIPKILGLGRLVGATWKHSWLPTLGISKVRQAEFVAILGADVQYLSTGAPKLMYAWVRDGTESVSFWHQIHP